MTHARPPLAPVRSISVLLPIYQGARFLERVLSALASQKTDLPWDFLAIDCGSTDGTLEIFERFREAFPVPLRVQGIRAGEFNHGDTRNLLAASSAGELLVFLTDDAIPASDGWLAQLSSNFADPQVAGAYCRNVPRPEAELLVRIFSKDDPTYSSERRETRLPPDDVYARMEPFERRLLCNYSDTASAMRRELWERHPYPRCAFGEDGLQARAFLEAGYTVVFDDLAIVQHSHEYESDETESRAADDAAYNAMWFDRTCVDDGSHVDELVRRRLELDRSELEREGFDGDELRAQLERAEELRRAFFQGLYRGGRTTRRYAPTEVRDRSDVRVLYVAPGGAESRMGRYAAALAAELRARGHHCAVLAADRATDFGAALDRERPDLVHFLEVRDETRGWLDEAKGRGLPVVVHFGGAPEAQGARDAATERACLRADLVVCTRRSLREDLLVRAGCDPIRALFSPRGVSDEERERAQHDPELLAELAPEGQRLKPLDENAREMEFHYRGVLSRSPERLPSDLIDAPGTRTSAREGAVDPQDSDMVVLRPDGAAVEYELRDEPAAERELRLLLATRRDDGDAVFGGRVLVDGDEVAVIDPFTSTGDDDLRLVSVRVTVPEGARQLRMENRLEEGGEGLYLRIKRVALRQLDERQTSPPGGGLLLDRPGNRVDRTEGSVSAQGVDMLLLAGRGAALEYSLEGVGVGSREIAVYVPFLSTEAALELGGRVLIDGRAVGRLGPFRSDGTDGVRVFRLRLEFDRPPRRLRVENRKRRGGRKLYLRVKRVAVRALDEHTEGVPAFDSWAVRARAAVAPPAAAES